MGRKASKKPKENPWVVMTFADGPRAGQTIEVAKPPVRYLKLAMPEWTVYERAGTEYRLAYRGKAAQAWRNPERPQFADPGSGQSADDQDDEEDDDQDEGDRAEI